ncbi:hypothetical protein EMEDMD4_40045 [Sinorhizobium medicae]|uniref:Uncharacterized protein n=1 Tax=Sinorhizobium medicae TaxID=110321 RepID=A0A508WYF2_9HYPH|nr:hypothetical protein EMEDMD4_40045 [Sinorhizobium medicae]
MMPHRRTGLGPVSIFTEITVDERWRALRSALFSSLARDRPPAAILFPGRFLSGARQ